MLNNLCGVLVGCKYMHNGSSGLINDMYGNYSGFLGGFPLVQYQLNILVLNFFSYLKVDICFQCWIYLYLSVGIGTCLIYFHFLFFFIILHGTEDSWNSIWHIDRGTCQRFQSIDSNRSSLHILFQTYVHENLSSNWNVECSCLIGS